MPLPSSLLASRREILKFGVYTGVTALAASAAATQAAESRGGLLSKTIPATGQKLPCVGIGTNSFTVDDVPNLQAVLKRMSELGGSFIDAAASYKGSEVAIGQVMNNLKLRDKFFISSKISSGPKIMGDLGGDKAFERSLQRLNTDHLDLLLVHNMLGTEELMPKMLEWKKAGKIRNLGISTSDNPDHAQMAAFMKKYPMDFIEVNYSIANRASDALILPLAQERKIAVVANQPFGGKHEENLLRDNKRVLPAWAAELNCSSWSEFLLKFVISHPAVTVVVPGTTKMDHMESNLKAGNGPMPDAAMRKRMADVWNV